MNSIARVKHPSPGRRRDGRGGAPAAPRCHTSGTSAGAARRRHLRPRRRPASPAQGPSRGACAYSTAVPTEATIPAEEAIADAVTGDVWLFRGRTLADKAIRTFTNAPVNHVAMVIAMDDLPPLLWHTEMGQALEDVWTGTHHRGAQLNRLADAYGIWTGRYGQQAWVRQFRGDVTREMEDELLRVVEMYDG